MRTLYLHWRERYMVLRFLCGMGVIKAAIEARRSQWEFYSSVRR